MKHVILRLSDKNNHAKYFDLRFKLLDNTFVPKWIDRVLEAQQKQYPISEPWAMYNINDSMDEKFIKDNLNRLMAAVDSVEKLFDLYIDDLNDQPKLNKIHAVFEKYHGKLDDWKTNELFKGKPDSFRKDMSEINQFVHACESLHGAPKIRVVWFDLPKHKKFTKEDYALFTNERNFGSLYHLYADVGKNIESVAYDNDDHHHEIVPNLTYSADCVLYLDDAPEKNLTEFTHPLMLKLNATAKVTRKRLLQEVESRQKAYIDSNKEFLSSKGFKENDPRLTTGRIEIARLETDLSKSEIMFEIKKYNNIQSLFLT